MIPGGSEKIQPEIYVLILRCLSERGETQREALSELVHRGSWLEPDQQDQGEITEAMYDAAGG